MSPTFISPQFSPTPMFNTGQPRFTKSGSRLRMRFCIASAASTPWIACSGSFSGAPQKDMIASPMYLSIVPRFSWMTSVISVKYAFIMSFSPSGVRPSEIEVKSRTSEKSTVISRLSPRIEYSSGFFDICATSSFGT